MRKKLIIKIDGMSCEHCAKKVQSALYTLENVKKVKVSLKKKEALLIINESIDYKSIKKAIDDLEYEILDIKEV